MFAASQTPPAWSTRMGCSWSARAGRPSGPAQGRGGTGKGTCQLFAPDERGRRVTEPDQVTGAAEAAMAARAALHGASRRRADATASAQQLIDNTIVTEKAEKDAARAALAASIRRLDAEEVPIEDIADLCNMPPDSVRVLIDRPTSDIGDGSSKDLAQAEPAE